MARSIIGREIELARLELPQKNVDRDITLTLSLRVVNDPPVLERALAKLLQSLLEPLDQTFVNTTALVDEPSRRRLARVDMADVNNVDVSLLLGYFPKTQVGCGSRRKASNEN